LRKTISPYLRICIRLEGLQTILEIYSRILIGILKDNALNLFVHELHLRANEILIESYLV